MTITSCYHGYAAHAPKSDLQPFTYEPLPLGPEDVEIKISHCGICASDIHTMDSGWGPTQYPVIVGHEIVGTVTAVGPEVTALKIGDRVGVGAQQYGCLQSDCQECQEGHDNMCPRMWWTYNSKRPDGSVTQGGYADHIRVRHQWAFPIPEAIDSVSAGPLLCAGLTVYAPLARANIGPGKKVGVIGIGGLGHLALQFAAALGAEVTAISHSPSKKAEALSLGATNFITLSSLRDHKRAFDIIVVSANHKGQDWGTYLTALRPFGTLILVALPEEDISVTPHFFTGTQVSITGSVIGNRKEMREMLELAAAKGIKPLTQTAKLEEVNGALEKVRKGDVRYRMVLEI
ncbi:hypothetical protein HDV00_010948 [Rhizophlyctis rosea]|nr:hypothetical protein HDV00_010948 [Rhizophlyctis rosea]